MRSLHGADNDLRKAAQGVFQCSGNAAVAALFISHPDLADEHLGNRLR
jgi:hypothetical protein